MGNVEELVRELRNYGIQEKGIQRLLDILKFIYMVQWCDGVPEDAVKNYWKDIRTLFQLDLIETGYEHGYGGSNIYCTKKGCEVSSQLVSEHIQKIKEKIRDFLDRYSKKFIVFNLFLSGIIETYSFESTKDLVALAHNPLTVATLKHSKGYENRIKKFWQGLVSLGLVGKSCVRNFEGPGRTTYSKTYDFYMLPPETTKFIENFIGEEIKAEREIYTIYQTLLNINNNFLKILSENQISEIKIKNIIDEAYSYSITSKYILGKEKKPFLILNEGEYKKFLDKKFIDPIIKSSTTEEGCFIATAAYGTPCVLELQILRQFRNEHLMKNAFGRLFVNAYYQVSPTIASFIGRYEITKSFTRAILIKPIVVIIKNLGFVNKGSM